jgi:hypothetical protein
MPKYLITYHGGEGMPADEGARREAMAAFMAWVQGAGGGVVDPGAPLGASRTVRSAGETTEPAADRMAGYTVVEADSLDAAADLVRTHPFITRGGALQVWEAAAP